jgi:fibronectin type 3 domain-containing protein
MIQASITAKRGLDERIKEAIDNKVENSLKDLSLGVVDSITALTPTVTGASVGTGNAEFSIGAYANSHSFRVNNTSSRGRRVQGSTSTRNAKARQKANDVYDPAVGLAKLREDVLNADYEDVRSITFRNDSEHAQAVEKRYRVYSQAGIRAGRKG